MSETKATYDTVEEMVKAVTQSYPKSAAGMDVLNIAGWDGEVKPFMKLYSEAGWLIVPGSVHVAILPNSGWGDYASRDLPRPYIICQMWRQKASIK